MSGTRRTTTPTDLGARGKALGKVGADVGCDHVKPLILAWARAHERLVRAGVEGTGSYGAGLARFLDGAGIAVIEVTRSAREGRRHLGKNDTVYAVAAARAVLADRVSARPKARDGIVESITVLRVARQTAVKARTQAALQIRTLIISAPDPLRDELIGLKAKKAAERCATLRPVAGMIG